MQTASIRFGSVTRELIQISEHALMYTLLQLHEHTEGVQVALCTEPEIISKQSATPTRNEHIVPRESDALQPPLLRASIH